MRDLLTKHRIPTTNIAAASGFLSSASDETVAAFISDLGLSLSGSDALSAARFAADAILRGAGSVDKVVGYVAKRMTGTAPKPAVATSPVRIVGEPVVDTPEVVVAPVVMETAPAVKMKGKRGRPRLGNSDFCTAVAAIEAAPKGSDRATLLSLIAAQSSAKGGTIKDTSAIVYLWRYNKGERE